VAASLSSPTRRCRGGGLDAPAPGTRRADRRSLGRLIAAAARLSFVRAGTTSDRPEEAAITTIVPRWEWRTFREHFDAAEEALLQEATGPAQESDERYLLSEPDRNVKIRDDLLDVKVLREVDAQGLERWEPVMKATFPLAASDVPGVVEAIGVDPSALPPGDHDLEGFLAAIEKAGTARAVVVHKRRTRASLMGCMAEVAEVSAEGRSTRTIAVEAEDPAAVIAAIRELHLDGFVNTSYPKGLRAVIEDRPPRFAVIDVGTNSLKFHIGERESDGSWRTITDRAEVTRLGEQLDGTGMIGEEPLERSIGAAVGMVEEARREGVRSIVAVGTAGLRIATDKEHAIAVARDRTGVTIEELSEIEESRLGYLGATSELEIADGSLVVFDTGGGSSQFTFGHGSEVDEQFSVKVGAARFSERFELERSVEPGRLDEVLGAIAEDLSRLDGRPSPQAMVGMGGAITNMTAVSLGLAEYDPDRVQGSVLERAEVDRQVELYRSRDAEGRRAIVGLQPKRAEVILAGACIVRTVMDKLGMTSLTVSDRGLRHGVLLDRFSG
jgi:exopolyphosphatase/guanosine-5'-triphosphate,3'-diphosphate pyrophosphatase